MDQIIETLGMVLNLPTDLFFVKAECVGPQVLRDAFEAHPPQFRTTELMKRAEAQMHEPITKDILTYHQLYGAEILNGAKWLVIGGTVGAVTLIAIERLLYFTGI